MMTEYETKQAIVEQIYPVIELLRRKQEDYGDALNFFLNFRRLTGKAEIELVAMMLALKCVRFNFKAKIDSLIDFCGYAVIGIAICQRNEKQKTTSDPLGGEKINYDSLEKEIVKSLKKMKIRNPDSMENLFLKYREYDKTFFLLQLWSGLAGLYQIDILSE